MSIKKERGVNYDTNKNLNICTEILYFDLEEK